MLKEVINCLRGQLLIRVECAFPERVLNLCSARNLAFWDLTWESPVAFSCRMSRQDWHALRRAAKNLDCTLTVAGREGAPYFISRFQHRQALLIGLTVCAFALVIGSFFVWEFDVEGNETVPTEKILRALEKSGVHLGSFGLTLDGEDIRNHVLLDVPELSWITVNVFGCRAQVQVRERIPKPEIVDERTPTNVIARRAGVVTHVQALDGVACVLKGSTVEEGQLLISGVEDTDTFGARILAGMGNVQARTWYRLTTSVSLTCPEKQYTGKEKAGVSLVFGTCRVKFFRNSSIIGRNYDKITTRRPLRLLGISLPVTLVTEVWRFYETVPAEQPETELQSAMETVLTDYLHSIVDPYGTVKSTLCTAREKSGILQVTLAAECEEQIGKQIPILTEESGEQRP